jgi:hypothetical protein
MNKLTRIFLGLIVAQLAGWSLAQQTSAAPQDPAAQPTPAPPSVLSSLAGEGNLLRLQLSPYTYHINADTNHKNVVLVGLEREHPNGKLDGVAFFSNSFGQESIFIYPWGGTYKSIFGQQPLSFKWTAGLLYGYKPPFEKKVPLNHKGFSPGLIFALAYEFKPGWSAQVNVLGTAGVMLQFNVPLN